MVTRREALTLALGNVLALRSVVHGPTDDDGEHVTLETDRGAIACRFHPAASGDATVVWVFGAGGGLGGPAGGLYPRLAGQLAPEGVASLRLDYRRPGELAECVFDTLVGIAYVGTRGCRRVVLVGHSFGGAVVITAGALSEAVIAVAALSSQTYGTGTVGSLAPRPLLLLHGSADEVLPDRASRDIYARAKEPKQLKLYPGCRHGLDQCRDELDRDLLGWIRDVVQQRPAR
jgi:alpha-beta hydrolase superfamily lysophospholipase